MQSPVSSEEGLKSAEAQRRLAQDGPNELPQSQPRSLLRLMREVVLEPMFLLLVACGVIYMLLGNRSEALMLLGFVLVVMGITLVQQRRTERSLEALRDLSSPRALVVRDGQACRIAGRELVCGDLVLLAEGDRVPADMVLVESSHLRVDESMLTGESVAVDKHAVCSGATESAGDIERVFAGTLVTQGTARGRVDATGARSALGRIGSSLASLETERTPLQQEVRTIVRRVALVGMTLAAGLALAYALRSGAWLQGLLAGLTLAMAILPEELPVVLTLFLGLGAWRLAREKVLARSMPAVELLGATTVLCVDKTGTLTSNRMVLRQLRGDGEHYDTQQHQAMPLQEALHGLLEFAVLASHRQAFDPMEAAIGAAGQQLLAETEHLHADWTLVNDYPLSREMLAMSRVWQSPDRRERMIAAKGAPEAIVDLCHLDRDRIAAITRQVTDMAAQGLRVLGVAKATFAAQDLPGNQHDFEFEFLGLLGLEDPVRADVPEAIAQCHAAGIRVVMVTGDHPATALSIARQAGLSTQGGVVTGAELANMDEATLQARLVDVHIFCRVQPQQKLRLVQAFRARGDIVAMTGDGVNDAPALKSAHIGVAMGARGTDVARESAALVLLNDDFASLVTAVRYGRRVFANLRKAMVFVLAAHVPIVGLSLLPVMMGWPLLLLPVHILFLQLIIDPACSVVFEAQPPEPQSMQEPPRAPQARLFDAVVVGRGLWQGAGLFLVLLLVYLGVRGHYQSDDLARSATFTTLALSNLSLIYANRRWGAWGIGEAAQANPFWGWISAATVVLLACVLGIPAVRTLFAFAPLSPTLLGCVLAAALLAWGWFECVKWKLAG